MSKESIVSMNASSIDSIDFIFDSFDKILNNNTTRRQRGIVVDRYISYIIIIETSAFVGGVDSLQINYALVVTIVRSWKE